MTTIITNGFNNTSVYTAGTDSEERLVRLSAFYKRVCFDVEVSPAMCEVMTKTNPEETVARLLSNGEPLDKQKHFWVRRLDAWHASYKKLMDDEEKYVGRDMDVLILDIIKEATSSPDGEWTGLRRSEFEARSDREKCQYWMWGWFLGVGVLTHLGWFEKDDDNNGFLIMTGPKSLMTEYGKAKEEEAVKMRKDISGGDPLGLD
jgi:hypothetical protein